MKMSAKEFLTCDKKQITLLGMSGAGKTTLANKLSPKKWFHYSGDYRIGTQYLSEPILDNIKQQAMDTPFLKDLLISDSIYICNNITVDNLMPISSFMGKIGNPELGGLSLETFKKRQLLHREAEIAAMKDVPKFIKKAQDIYGYNHFINDAGGSVCELNDPEILSLLAQHTLIIYIKTSEDQEQLLFERAQQDPKPLYYRADFKNNYSLNARNKILNRFTTALISSMKTSKPLWMNSTTVVPNKSRQMNLFPGFFQNYFMLVYHAIRQ